LAGHHGSWLIRQVVFRRERCLQLVRRPHRTVMALAPEQVMVLLEAADHTPSPWLGTWTVLAAATGARNGELCGLEWSDQAWTPAPSGSARPSSLLTHNPPRHLKRRRRRQRWRQRPAQGAGRRAQSPLPAAPSVQIGDEPQGSVFGHTEFADKLAEPDQLAVDPPVTQAGFSAAGRSIKPWTCPAVDGRPGRLRR
jgi:predicted component of type VI protein secretion system